MQGKPLSIVRLNDETMLMHVCAPSTFVVINESYRSTGCSSEDSNDNIQEK